MVISHHDEYTALPVCAQRFASGCSRRIVHSEVGPTAFWDVSTLPEMHFIV
jgi:hypothetical protein